MSAEALAQVLQPLQDLFDQEDYPDLLVGLGIPDDAAVWRLDDDRALVVTTDFFTPVVDDPYDYGAIAAANALSDLYAMGATPTLALNIAAMPLDLPIEVVTEIMRGGAEKVREAGAVVAGGHTIQDKEPKYGLVALGMCEISKLMTKAQAQAGDVLILTKPLGMGVTTTALKRGTATREDVDQAVRWMKQLNGPAAQLASEFDVRASTDITGFSLLGHGLELAEASGVALRLHLPAIPFLSEARRYAEQGNFPGGSFDNRSHFGNRVRFAASIDEYNQLLLFDAQTSGGLLLSLQEIRLRDFIQRAMEIGVDVWPVGLVETGEGILVNDTPFDTGVESADLDGDLWFQSPV